MQSVMPSNTYRQSPTERNLHILRSARSSVQETARQCANEYWTELSDKIQTASASGNIRGMYEGIIEAISKTAPLKSASGEKITDKHQQLERWVKHYSELYATENVVSAQVLDAIDDLPVMEELDSVPTLEDLSKAVNSLSSGRAPGSDGIPPDLIKHCKTTLLQPLHKLLCQCWHERSIPQDMRDSKIITLYSLQKQG